MVCYMLVSGLTRWKFLASYKGNIQEMYKVFIPSFQKPSFFSNLTAPSHWLPTIMQSNKCTVFFHKIWNVVFSIKYAHTNIHMWLYIQSYLQQILLSSSAFCLSGSLFKPELGGNMFIRNADGHLAIYAVLYPISLSS